MRLYLHFLNMEAILFKVGNILYFCAFGSNIPKNNP